MIQVVSVLGSLAILAAYAASQFRRLAPSSLTYLVLNAAGSGVLAVVAIIERQWGFLLLEGVWALVSVWSLFKLAAGRESGRPAAGGHV
jgi:hypothetical protein